MIRLGILGAGSVARRRVIPAIKAESRCGLGALMVREQARAEQLAAEFGAPRAYSSVAALVADPALDAIYISTPVYLHAEHVEAAAAAGKHVLCEKPLARNRDECHRIRRACDNAGVHLEVCFVLRGWPVYQHIRHIMASGRLGKVVEIRAHLAKWTTREADEWRLDARLAGGGTFVDVGSHYLDLFRFLLGDMARIGYMDSRAVFGWPVEESAFALIEFDNGAHGSLSVSCTVPHNGPVLEVYGTRGSLFLGKDLRILDADGEETGPVSFPDYYGGLLGHFCTALQTGGPPLASGEDGLRNIQAIEAAYASGATGRIVDIVRD